MPRKLLVLTLSLFAAISASAQTTTITASNLVDISGAPLANGYFQLTPVGAVGHAIAFEANGKQYSPVAHNWPITNGSIGAGVTVPDALQTSPAIGYQVQILDNATPVPHVIAYYPALIYPTGPTWSFDAWQQPSAPIVYASGTLVAFGGTVPAHCVVPSSGYTNDGSGYFCIGGSFVRSPGSGGTVGDAAGDVTGPYSNLSVEKIKGQTPGDIVTHNVADLLVSNSIRAWGDSLTSGNQDGQSDSYPNYLNQNLGRPAYNYGVGGYTSTQILGVFNSTNPSVLADTQVFWVGRNDMPNNSTPLANIATMVAALPSPKRYAVMSVIDSELEPTGNAVNIGVQSMNASLAAAYPNNFLDINSLLINQATGSFADQYDKANNIVPLSLRATLSTGTLSAAITTTSQCAISLSAPGVAVGTILSVDSEYIEATTFSGNNITGCVRGFYGSTAATHSSGVAYIVRDSLHLSAAGYAFVASQVANFIQAHFPAASSDSVVDGLSNQFAGVGTFNNHKGTRNTIFGNNALPVGVNTDDIVSLGYGNLLLCATCQTVEAVGTQNFPVATSIKGDASLGFNNFALLTTGNYNVATGQTACNTLTTGSNNGCYGTSSGVAAAADHATVVGAGATSICSSCVTLGRSLDDVYIPKTTSAPVLGTDATGKIIAVASAAPLYTNNGVALPTTQILANTCTAATGSPFTATGVATTNQAAFGWAGDPTGVLGYGSTGGLEVRVFPGAATVTVKVCNPNSTPITPGAMSINVRVNP